MSYLVKYKAFGSAQQAGPYDTLVKATSHFDDIRGYEGITNAEIVPELPKSAIDRLLEDDR